MVEPATAKINLMTLMKNVVSKDSNFTIPNYAVVKKDNGNVVVKINVSQSLLYVTEKLNA